MTFLDPNGQPTDINPDFSIQTLDLEGEIEDLNIGSDDSRSLPDEFEDWWGPLLAEAEISTEAAFALKATDQRPSGAGGQFRNAPFAPTTRDGDEALVFTAKYTQPNEEYVVLYRDEAGIYSWIFPNQQPGQPVRSGGELTFHLPRAGAPDPPKDDEAKERGPWAAGGRRVIRFLRWTIRDKIGEGVFKVAEWFENRKRQYGFHHVAKDQIGGDVNWDHIRGGRALLLVHGTFSTGQAAYTALVQNPQFAELAARYDNRVFAFNHPSMTASPQENIQWLLDNLPDETSLELDIVSHSRGGLVTRTISEQLGQLKRKGRQILVGKAIFVGTPHQGTVMADGEHWYDLVDRYTNFVTDMPDTAGPIVAEAILTVVKLLAYGGLHGLPGIRSMVPNGSEVQQMNSAVAHDTTYYAIAADFTPNNANLLVRLRKEASNFVMDRIFEGADNDGVVPTEGCYQVATASHGFPIPAERYRKFEEETHHLNYFTNKALVQQLVDWLT